MKNKNKKLTPLNILVFSVIMIVAGAIILAIGFVSSKGKIGIVMDKDGFHYAYDKKTEKIPLELQNLDNFKDLDIKSSFFDVHLVESDKFAIKGTDKDRINFEVKGNKLTLKTSSSNERGTISIFYFPPNNGINIIKDEIYIYYPKSSGFDDMTFNISHGEIEMGSLEARDMEMKIKFVDMLMKDVKAENFDFDAEQSESDFNNIEFKNLKSIMRFGDLNLTDVVIDGNMTFDGEFGDVDFTRVKSKTLDIKNKQSTIKTNNLNISGNAKVNTEFTTLNFTDFTAKDTNLKSKFSTMYFNNVNIANFDIDDEQGSVRLSGTVLGNISIKDRFGDVKLDLKGKMNDYLIVANNSNFSTVQMPTGYNISKVNNSKYKILMDVEQTDVDIDID